MLFAATQTVEELVLRQPGRIAVLLPMSTELGGRAREQQPVQRVTTLQRAKREFMRMLQNVVDPMPLA